MVQVGREDLMVAQEVFPPLVRRCRVGLDKDRVEEGRETRLLAIPTRQVVGLTARGLRFGSSRATAKLTGRHCSFR